MVCVSETEGGQCVFSLRPGGGGELTAMPAPSIKIAPSCSFQILVC